MGFSDKKLATVFRSYRYYAPNFHGLKPVGPPLGPAPAIPGLRLYKSNHV